MKQKISYLLFLVLICTNILAQDDESPGFIKNKIGIEAGINVGYLKDRNFSPLNYNETGAIFSLNYIHVKPAMKSILTADLDFTNGKLKADPTDFFNAISLSGNLEVSLLWKVSQSKNNRLLFFLGPQYNSYLQYIDWNERETWSYLTTHGIDLKGSVLYKLSDKKTFQSSLSIPIVQLLVRPPYNGFDQYIVQNQEKVLKILLRGELASFDKYYGFDWKTLYKYAASNHLDFNLSYMLRFQQVNGFNKMVHFQNQLTAGFSIKF
ncbi:hypothetical protein [Rubrolithibacter danxiaensis]|uniref:hypothetical protein n=1 Tax=Rubrolithibacter danxiaensis TaxID=3390805 RepID=UPI003BF82A1D